MGLWGQEKPTPQKLLWRCVVGVEFSPSVYTVAIAASGMSTCRSEAGRHREDLVISFPWQTASKDFDQDRSPFPLFS